MERRIFLGEAESVATRLAVGVERRIFPGGAERDVDFSKGFVFFKKQYTLIKTARNCCDLSMGAKWFRLPRQIAGGMQRMIVGLFNHRSKK